VQRGKGKLPKFPLVSIDANTILLTTPKIDYFSIMSSVLSCSESSPPLAQLIVNAGIPRVVIGCPDPVSERATKGASLLHASGLNVEIGVHREQCEELIAEYAQLANTKLHRVARKQVKQFGRPLGFLHCSVIDSDDAEAFARNGNAFGNNLGLSRDTGAYEIAPPPFVVWVGKDNADDNEVVFEDEEQGEVLQRSPMMPWYIFLPFLALLSFCVGTPLID
jgi:hypothetical protein